MPSAGEGGGGGVWGQGAISFFALLFVLFCFVFCLSAQRSCTLMMITPLPHLYENFATTFFTSEKKESESPGL